AVLAGAGAAHLDGPVHHALVHAPGAPHLVLVGVVHQQHEVEVAVADVAHDGGDERVLVEVRAGGGDALGQAGDRNAHIGGPDLPAGAQRLAGVGGIVAGAPESVALLGVGGPREIRTAVLGGDGADRLGLLGHRRLAAVKLEEQR